MNKAVILFVSLLLAFSLLCACQAPAASPPPAPPASAVGLSPSVSPATVSTPSAASSVASPAPLAYKDGTYTYTGGNDGEGYYVKATMVIQDGKIASMDWQILDSLRKDKVFDDQYEKVYTNVNYIQQCRDNMKGLVQFVPQLLQVQDPGKVDTVSGATWVYNKFQEAAKALLAQAAVK